MRKNLQTIFVNTILALVVSIVCLIALEFLLLPFWATGSTNRDLALLGFIATPNTIVDDTPINDWGFTGSVLSNEYPGDDTIRILTLGGSALFNRRMTERMVKSWEKKFAADLEIVGGALRTHTSRASLIKMKYLFSQYKFDYVLIYHGINDLWASNVPATAFNEDYSHLDPWNKRSELLDHSLTARFTFNLLSSREGVFPQQNSNAADFAAVRTFEQNILQIVNMVIERGGQPVLMSFASHIPEGYTLESFRSYSLGYNNPDHYDECPVELWGTPEYVREGLIKNNNILRKVAREMDLPLIDLDQSLSQDITNFGDPVHLSDSGTDRLVEIVGNSLRELEYARQPR